MEGACRLLGRSTEQAHLELAVERAARGPFVMIAIEGEAGIGKSELVEFTMTAARAAGFTLWHVKADEFDRDRPFGTLRTMLQRDDGERRVVADGLNRIAHSRAGYGFLETTEPSFHVIDRVVNLAERRLTRTPLAVLVDDAQWADEATTRALAHLSRRLADRTVLLVVAARLITRHGELAALVSRVDPSDRLIVGPLDESDVAELVAQRLGRTPSDSLLADVARGGGNPFFVGALLDRHPRDDRRGSPGDDGTDRNGAPSALQTTVLHQLDDLGRDTSRVLRVAAVLGGAFAPSLLAEITDRSIAELVPMLEIAVAAGVLDEDDVARLRFRHDLVREIAYGSMSPSLRRALHLDIGRRMAALGRPPADTAVHFLRGAETGDVAAAAVLRQAAIEIGRVAPRVAATLLERAAEILPEHDPEHRSCLVELAQLWVFANEVERSSALADELLATTVPVELELDVREVRSQLHFLRGEARQAVAEFEAMLPLVEDDPREVVVLADAAVSAMFAVELDRARSLADRAVARSELHDERVGRTLAVSLQSWLTAFGGDLDGAVERAAEAVRIADSQPGFEAHRNVPLLFYGQALLWADDVDRARAVLRRGRQISARLGMGWDEPMFRALFADERTRAGEWDDALAEAEAGLARADEVGSHAADSWLHVHRARVLLFRGDVDAASVALDDAAAGLGGSGGQGADQVLLLRALVAVANGDDAAANSIAVVLWRRLGELGVGLRQLEFAPDMIRIGLRCGDTDFVTEVVSTVERVAARWPTRLSRTAAHWSAALVHDDPDRGAAAVSELRGRSHVVDLVRCQLDLADVRARGGVPPPAAATSHGAVRGIDRWEGLVLLHRRDAERRTTRTERTTTIGWEGLTPSEQRVTELVGHGLSNADIAERLSISRRTVESHLYHAYPKLGLSSRVELAVRAAARRHRTIPN